MDWSNLGDGPAGMIAERLIASDVADYVRFRAVCLPWRLCCMDPRAHDILDRRFHPRRWIMLREKVADPDRRRLLNVSTGQCVRAHLPELRGHDVCVPTVEGLLVLLNRTTYAVRLLNPLTRHVSDLPPATTLYPMYRRRSGMGEYDNTDPRLDFEVSAAGLADDSMVAVLFEKVQMLAVAKPGDERWTLVKQGTRLSPAISFAGRFYCTARSEIQMVDIRHGQPPGLVVAARILYWLTSIHSSMLLEKDGELMLLIGTFEPSEVGDFTAEARYFMLARVDLDARKTHHVPMPDIGGRDVFAGPTCAISVSPSALPTIKKDSVYLGNDHLVGGGYLGSTGPYTFVDGTTTMRYDRGGGFHNNIPQYGPRSIIDYLSHYVTNGASDSFAEEDTSDLIY